MRWTWYWSNGKIWRRFRSSIRDNQCLLQWSKLWTFLWILNLVVWIHLDLVLLVISSDLITKFLVYLVLSWSILVLMLSENRLEIWTIWYLQQCLVLLAVWGFLDNWTLTWESLLLTWSNSPVFTFSWLELLHLHPVDLSNTEMWDLKNIMCSAGPGHGRYLTENYQNISEEKILSMRIKYQNGDSVFFYLMCLPIYLSIEEYKFPPLYF